MPAGLHGIGQKDGTGGEWFRKHADRKTRIGGIGATSLPCLRLPFPVIPPNSRPMLAPILSYEDLGLIQGSGWLFQGLDLYIGERDRLALIGRNGAGKPTLLKLIAGKIGRAAGRARVCQYG